MLLIMNDLPGPVPIMSGLTETGMLKEEDMFIIMDTGAGPEAADIYGSRARGNKEMADGIGEGEDGGVIKPENFSWDVNTKVVHSFSRMNNFFYGFIIQ